MITKKLPERPQWLCETNLQKILSALKQGQQEARIVGGAVRNALFKQPVEEIDIATTTKPEETIKRIKALGFSCIPTGILYGTVTVITPDRTYEVTTLRADVETYGRKAKVIFGSDWQADAERRDFTINALYLDIDGTLYDYLDCWQDIESKTIRFIGHAEDRIQEDYLRILRFFRFFAWYGQGRPDAAGVKAAAKLKNGLKQLSVERVWNEIKKLLSAHDPARALLWMRQTGVLTTLVPETEKWGIDFIHSLIETEQTLMWPIDPILRLESLLPPDDNKIKTLSTRLKLSNVEKKRLLSWARLPLIKPDISDLALKKMLYQQGKMAICDQLCLALSSARALAANNQNIMQSMGDWSRLVRLAQAWERPSFPVKGSDLMAIGYPRGEQLGQILKKLENQWIDHGFQMTAAQLLGQLQADDNTLKP